MSQQCLPLFAWFKHSSSMISQKAGSSNIKQESTATRYIVKDFTGHVKHVVWRKHIWIHSQRNIWKSFYCCNANQYNQCNTNQDFYTNVCGTDICRVIYGYKPYFNRVQAYVAKACATDIWSTSGYKQYFYRVQCYVPNLCGTDIFRAIYGYIQYIYRVQAYVSNECRTDICRVIYEYKSYFCHVLLSGAGKCWIR